MKNLDTENIIQEAEGLPTGVSMLESRPIHMQTKEDEKKLSFARGNSKHNSNLNNNDYEDRQSVPTRGQTNGLAS